MGFRRREQALRDLSQVLGCTRSVWEAVQTWQIQPKGPRAADPASVYKAGEWVRAVEAYDRVQQRELQHLFHSFLAALITYFDCVRAGRARHTVGWHQEEQAHLFCTLREQRAIVDSHISQMRRLIQDVKVMGLPGGEAHRIDNYINMIGVGFERLCAVKEYRTPRAFRAFARVYILLVRTACVHCTCTAFALGMHCTRTAHARRTHGARTAYALPHYMHAHAHVGGCHVRSRLHHACAL